MFTMLKSTPLFFQIKRLSDKKVTIFIAQIAGYDFTWDHSYAMINITIATIIMNYWFSFDTARNRSFFTYLSPMIRRYCETRIRIVFPLHIFFILVQ